METWYLVVGVVVGFLTLNDFSVQAVSEGSSSDQKLQCYACGLPSINPEKDLDGSYGAKTYNHTCDEAFDASAAGDEIALRRFLRTCPAGVQSCFGSDGYYNHEDDNATIEIDMLFLGCSEATYAHDYGCDSEMQAVPFRDKSGQKSTVNIDVKLCFCSEHSCNIPSGDLVQLFLIADNGVKPSIIVSKFLLTLILITTTMALYDRV